MGCRHSLIGSPDWCSQCRGVQPRIVMRDDATGAMMIDGQPVERKFMLPSAGPQTANRRGRRKASRSIIDVGEPELMDD